MIDLRAIADSFSFDDPDPFPDFPGKSDGNGNTQHIDKNDFSRCSRVSRSETHDSNNRIVCQPNATDYPDRNTEALARRRPYVGEAGNPGTAGNNSDISAIPFPFVERRTGKTGKAPSAGGSFSTPQTALRQLAGAGRSGWTDIDRPLPSPARSAASCQAHREPNLPGHQSDGPEHWQHWLYGLNSSADPCPGFRAGEWWNVFDACHAFLQQHAEAAHVLGWTTLDLFAVHALVGAARVDCCGALMVSTGATVSAVERDVIHYVRTQDGQPCGRFFRAPRISEMVPVWAFRSRPDASRL